MTEQCFLNATRDLWERISLAVVSSESAKTRDDLRGGAKLFFCAEPARFCDNDFLGISIGGVACYEFVVDVFWGVYCAVSAYGERASVYAVNLYFEPFFVLTEGNFIVSV